MINFHDTNWRINGSIPTAGSHYSDPRYSQPATESISSTADEALGCLHPLPAVSLSICAMFGPPLRVSFLGNTDPQVSYRHHTTSVCQHFHKDPGAFGKHQVSHPWHLHDYISHIGSLTPAKLVIGLALVQQLSYRHPGPDRVVLARLTMFQSFFVFFVSDCISSTF